MVTEGFFQFEVVINVLVSSFYSNTYGSMPIIEYFRSLSAETHLRRQILTSKVRPGAKRVKKNFFVFLLDQMCQTV